MPSLANSTHDEGAEFHPAGHCLSSELLLTPSELQRWLPLWLFGFADDDERPAPQAIC
jgi:hypothetical protein